MSNRPPPPPPPPVPEVRGNPGMQRPPQPPPGAQVPRPPPLGMPMQQMPIRQQSIRIQDITPPKLMDDSACLKRLTTYFAFTIRKCAPRDPKKEGRGTWARSEIIEERWTQEEIIKQIKKLSESRRSVADKKKQLMPNQQGQVTTLVDNLASGERDGAFEWSLVQLDSVTKPISILKGGKRREMYETVTMVAFVKRAPRSDLNPVILFQNIEKMKADSMRPPQQPQPQPQPQPQQGGHEPIQIFEVKGGDKNKAKGRSKSREKKYHEHDDSSTGDSFDSDTDSRSSFTGSDSMGTSISSKSRGHRRHSHSKVPFRSHSKHREPRRTYYLEQPRAHSPELHYEAYGGSPQPYVPDVPPRAIPAAIPAFDPVAAAYHAGKVDAEAERFGTADRVIPRPVERTIIERVRPVITYGPSFGALEPRYPEPRYPEPRYREDPYIDDLRRDDLLRRRERDVEEYIIDGRLDGRPEGRRPAEFIDRRDSFYDRRTSDPLIWNNRHPFAPTPLPRRYPRDDSSSGW
ncbi:hypothetical protein N431DRAFT_456252 [Stipitochalara longipes BDJ]|nr:hypothetical protein N431DRAFT_456252 [Stipitochalara longipes BDJ]